MRADEVIAGRGRGLIVFVLVGAAVLMVGVLVMLGGLIMQLADKRSFLTLIETGAVIAAGGAGFGVVVLFGYSMGRGLTGARRGVSPNGQAFDPRHDAFPHGRGGATAWSPQSPPPGHGQPRGYAQPTSGHTMPPGYATPSGYGMPPGHAKPPGQSPPPRYATPPGHGTPPGYPPPPAYGPPPGHTMPPGYEPDHSERERHHRGWRHDGQVPVIPTSVYSPGGLIGPPRDVRGQAPADGPARPAPGREFGYAQPAPGPVDDQPLGGEYAQVIHVDRPRPPREPAARPQAAPPPVPPEPELPDVFVYRDPDGDAQPEQEAAAPGRTRGPFEPLRREEPAPAGDQSAGQHGNGLLRRQRELITGYFKGTGITKPASFGAGGSGDAGGQEMVASEQQVTD